MTGFKVDTDELSSFAGKVDGLDDRVDECVSAAQHAIDPAAFGILCSFLVPMVTSNELAAKESIQTLGKAMASAGKAAERIAKSYDKADDELSTSIDKQTEQLG